MITKFERRAKTEKPNFLITLKIESHNMPSYQKSSLNSYNSSNNNQKILGNTITLLNEYKRNKIYNTKKTSIHSNINSKLNLKKIVINDESKNNNYLVKRHSSYSQYRDSFNITSNGKFKIYQIMKNKIIKKNNNKKYENDDLELNKENLYTAVYKKNPEPLLESIFRRTNPDIGIIKKNETGKEKLFLNTMKAFKRPIKKYKRDKKLIMSYSQKNDPYMQLINKIIKKKTKEMNIINNKQYFDNCFDFNKNIFNPTLQNLIDNNKYKNIFLKNKNKTTITENIDNIKNNNYELSSRKEINTEKELTINKKRFIDSSSDTALDFLISNNYNKNSYNNNYNNNYNKKVNIITNKLYLDINNNKIKNKEYIPRLKLYKNKSFNKALNKKPEKTSENNKKGVKFYDFNNIIDLFDKKIGIRKKAKLKTFNNFKIRVKRFYSSCNNININLLRMAKYKKKSIPKQATNHSSNRDYIEDIEASIVKNVLI